MSVANKLKILGGGQLFVAVLFMIVANPNIAKWKRSPINISKLDVLILTLLLLN